MLTVDADTHIDETEATWDWMTPEEAAFKPTTAYPQNYDPSRSSTRYWIIDGQRSPRPLRNDQRSGTTVETRELLDPAARIRDMDARGTEVQALYPSLFLVGVTDTPAIEVAIKRSYNRWLADRCAQSGGRLRWLCLPPFLDIPAAVEEIRYAKDHGACGILKKGDIEAGHWVNDEYFFPIYEVCQQLDLAVSFHIGSGTPDHSSVKEFAAKRFMMLGVPPLNAFNSLVQYGIPTRFPGVRWGFVEAGASWVPYLVYQLMRRVGRERLRLDDGPETYTYKDVSDIVRLNNFYITCQVDEELPFILRYTGEDRLLIGSDYTHADTSMELEFPRLLQARADAGDIPQSAVQKIAHDNGAAFYGL